LEERAIEIPLVDHTGDDVITLEPSLEEAANKRALPLSLVRRLLDLEASVTAMELCQFSQSYETFKPHEHGLQDRTQVDRNPILLSQHLSDELYQL
jgi:hypothetical protein